jgi:hypothetical protein
MQKRNNETNKSAVFFLYDTSQQIFFNCYVTTKSSNISRKVHVAGEKEGKKSKKLLLANLPNYFCKGASIVLSVFSRVLFFVDFFLFYICQRMTEREILDL